MVVGPWLVNTGSEVGPVTPAAGNGSTSRWSDSRRPAVGDVGAEPALDRLPATTSADRGGITQDSRSRSEAAALDGRPADDDEVTAEKRRRC